MSLVIVCHILCVLASSDIYASVVTVKYSTYYAEFLERVGYDPLYYGTKNWLNLNQKSLH
jgi:hypothetical protein